ncbi:DUF3612 domain-containing protein, partial [Vibrio sp. 10N.261.45.A4]
ELPETVTEASGDKKQRVARSYFEAPNILHINNILKDDPIRLKYDIAVNIGHMVLHQGDGEKSKLMSDSKPSYGVRDEKQQGGSVELDST